MNLLELEELFSSLCEMSSHIRNGKCHTSYRLLDDLTIMAIGMLHGSPKSHQWTPSAPILNISC
jgi:hypothetical protein